MNQIKAAASPMRKPTNSPSLKTPRRTPGKEDDLEGGLTIVGGTAVTPVKRIPILANFEEWIKMATDNKINATNSWNFALIDYFYDMSLLKEGGSVPPKDHYHITSLHQTSKQRKRSPNQPTYINDERNVFQSHQGQSGPEQDARARSEPESGFAEGSESIESGGAASGGCLPILEISGFKGSVSRVKLKIRRSWDPFLGCHGPSGQWHRGSVGSQITCGCLLGSYSLLSI